MSISVAWLPRLLDGRLTHAPTAWSTAAITRSAAPESATVPAGTFEVERWEAKPTGGPAHRYFVETAPPHRLIAWERDDGERGELLAAQRRTYWEENHEGQETIREELKLPPSKWPPGAAP